MSKLIKRMAAVVLCLSLVFSLCLGLNTVKAAENSKEVKNVILMIPDGTGITHMTLSRWYNGGTPLAVDQIASGLVRTFWAGGPITDSAPAATTMATGHKSGSGSISVLADANIMPGLEPLKPEDAKKPIATVLEGAKLKGKATGLVATVEVCHATPAAFASHDPDRNAYDNLSEQMVYEGIDVVLAGGEDVLNKDKRKDKEDLIAVIKNSGYDYITKRDEMLNSKSNKLWGAFASMEMAYDFNRVAKDNATGKPIFKTANEDEPSLAEMTTKAISILSKDADGFFLMVEGSKVDWASHANDPVGVISEFLAFNDAVKVALDYAKTNLDTAVIICPDHGNGGMSIGSLYTNGDVDPENKYDIFTFSKLFDPLKKASLTAEGVRKKINEKRSNVRKVMEDYYGITDLTYDEVKAIVDAKTVEDNTKGEKEKKVAEQNTVKAIGATISKRACIGWTTIGHTGEDVALFSYHPNSNSRLTGVIDDTDIAKYIAKTLGFNLDELTKTLFLPARSAFEAKGATVAWDNSDPANPVVVVTKGSDTLKLPVNKNIANLNGVVTKLNGVVVFNGKATFIPQQAVDLIK